MIIVTFYIFFIDSTIKIQLCSRGQQKASFKLCSKESIQRKEKRIVCLYHILKISAPLAEVFKLNSLFVFGTRFFLSPCFHFSDRFPVGGLFSQQSVPSRHSISSVHSANSHI